MELISVIVPIYKVEAYLDRCVSSIVGQTYKNLEVVLVDDGSPDNCPSMCDAWAAKDMRIKVIHKENGGLSDARNAGLAIATGDYISFVDSDDWIDESMLQTMVDVLQTEKADIVECGVSYIDESGTVLRVRSCHDELQLFDKYGALRALVRESEVFQTVWNKLYRKELLDGILFEVGKLNEDDYWTYQIFDRADKIAAINIPLYFYYQRNSSIMGEGYSVKRLDGLAARYARMEYLQKYPETADFTKARIIGDYMYHFQSALKYLNENEQSTIVDYILCKLKTIKKVNYNDSEIPVKYRVWYELFRRFPFAIANLRNRIGIGF